MKDSIAIKGMFRIQVMEDEEGGAPKLVGDSGWRENNITNVGMDRYILQLMSAGAGSLRVTHAAVGTGGAPADPDTTLAGEITHAAGSRAATTAVTSSSSRVEYQATFASSNSFLTATANLSNVGLFQQSNTNTASLFAGNTYTSSAIATNQNVFLSYRINFTG